MAAEGNIVRGIFNGEEEPEEEIVDEVDEHIWQIILPTVTHLSVCQSLSVIPDGLFCHHPNLIELICHDGVIKIERAVFAECPCLKRLVMPGVEEIEESAFFCCAAIEHIECANLEIIRTYAFGYCQSLESIDLPSAKIVEKAVFGHCTSLSDVKFGINLESIGESAFCSANLKRITIPLKNGLFTHDDVFAGCKNLEQVCLIEEETIQETIDTLLLDEWKNDMNEEIDSINQILPYADTGNFNSWEDGDITRAIREWIGRVLQKIIHYKLDHYRLMNEAATVISDILPNDILANNILPFISLPSHTFHGEDYHNDDLLNSTERGQKRPKLDDH